MTTRFTVYATYEASQISAARKDFYARAVRASGILAALHQSDVLDAWEFDAMLSACVRHAAKAHGMRARDLWAVLPEDVCARVERVAGVFTYC